MEKRIQIQIVNGCTYMKVQGLADKYSLSTCTIRRIKDEIKSLIGKRYKRQAVIEDQNIVLINELVFLDYLSVRNELKAGHKAEPFIASDWSEYQGKSIRSI